MTRILLIWIAAFAAGLLICLATGFFAPIMFNLLDHMTNFQLSLVMAAVLATGWVIILRK